MAGLFATLNSTVKAITAHSAALETTGKNLANVNNTSYARQRVIYGDRGTIATPTGAESLGLEALGVQQLRDQLLDLQVAREISITSGYEAEQKGYQRAQAALGQSIESTTTGTSDSGIGAALDNFFNSFQSLAGSPTSDGVRETLLQNATILTDRLQLADQRLQQVQDDLDTQITTDVSTVNDLLNTIAELNEQISRFEVNAAGTAVDLRDQRQARLEELAAKLPVTVKDLGDGTLQLSAKDTSGVSVMLVNGATVDNTVSFDGTQITAGTPAATLNLASGSIQGSLKAKTGAVQTLRDNLDALAGQLITSVNAAYNPSSVAGGNFFNGTEAGSIAVVGTITSASLKAGDGSASGNNSIALAIAGLASKTFSISGGAAIDGTFVGFYSKSVASIGQSLSAANSRVEDQNNIEELVRKQRDGVSGVSMDEELADLLKFQRAFQASSRVFNVVDELLDTVVNRLGA
ncbi:flagellar hook-associated protein FlgK [Opitutus sp. ER46]|uniref:flagellar hook-associated protein FlgK n=1 Tax=Opitutus sp. ER46 TaxID=2161864 RepID=UPI000D30F8D3|nr:flagellar hook-associated protein FlgK [Opitutus sp. ER46]PTX90927.1 flagellar hook-associated protein FlgK [Opitutus sp. ER46]